MQITLPENATHIVICTASNERKEIQIPRFHATVKQQQQQQQQQQQHQLETKKPFSRPDHADLPKQLPGMKKSGSGSKLEHVCNECGKKYSTSSNLARHKQTHRLAKKSSMTSQMLFPIYRLFFYYAPCCYKWFFIPSFSTSVTSLMINSKDDFKTLLFQLLVFN
jgi:uncharacterized Zn-finger protein